MQAGKRVLTIFTFVVLAVSVLWVVGLVSVIGNIYLSHAIPHSLSDWIVNVQIGSNYWPGQQPHSTLFYLARFYAATAVIVFAGVLSAFYLKRTRQGGDHGNRV